MKKKSTILTAAGLAGVAAVLVAPAAVADPRITVPFVPESVPFGPGDGMAATPSTA